MHNPKRDCTLNMVTVTFLLQHLFNVDEEVYVSPMYVSTVLGIIGSSGRCGMMQTETNLTLSGIIEQESQTRFGFWVIK